MLKQESRFDVAVIGAGHAGSEAAIATAKMGFKTLLLTINLSNIAFMPCNPSIGGPAKGHLVREIDALGGLMGRVTDQSHLQMRALNTHKGPAVRALRAQADKRVYQELVQGFLEEQPLITIRQGEVVSLAPENNQWILTLATGIRFVTSAVIIATGTFLRGKTHIGLKSFSSGPQGQQPSVALADLLKEMGIKFGRFKTGTPARVRRRSLNLAAMQEQPGDLLPYGFSYWRPWRPRDPVPCWLTYTNEETHRVIRDNLDKAALFSGAISGIGTRYCLSIEGKVVDFPQRDRHQVFIEPESLGSDEMYLSGLSSSLPEEVQERFIRTVPGLEKVEIVRPGYAIEYDVIATGQLTLGLQLRAYPGLFCAGQINGSSGYEEAAAQGLMAGINAGLYLRGEEPFILRRDQAYIGVLIDDLVTKENFEPYRIMTSRAEFRLSLRQDNADLRLVEEAQKYGLLSQTEYEAFKKRRTRIEERMFFLSHTSILPQSQEAREVEERTGITLKEKSTLKNLLRKPELNMQILSEIFHLNRLPVLEEEVVESNIKYEGYLQREAKMAERLRKMTEKKIPLGFDYQKVPNLSEEAREKLNLFQPTTIGQASRISGVSPADLSALLIWISRS